MSTNMQVRARVHQRGLGQVTTRCQFGAMPLGPAVAWEKVTCLDCRTAGFIEAFKAFKAVWDTLVEAVQPIAQAFANLAEKLGLNADAFALVEEDDRG